MWDKIADQGSDLARDIVDFVHKRGGEISNVANRFPPDPDYVEIPEPA